jgi:hypothetical protein
MEKSLVIQAFDYLDRAAQSLNVAETGALNALFRVERLKR